MSINEIDIDKNVKLRRYVPKYNTNGDNVEAFLGVYGSSAALVEVGLNQVNRYSFPSPETTDLPYFRDYMFLDSNDDASIVAYCYCGKPSDVPSGSVRLGGLFVYRDGLVKKIDLETTDLFKSDGTNNKARIRISSDGKYILTYTESHILYLTFNDSTTDPKYTISRLSFDTTNYSCVGCCLSEDGKIGIVKLKNKTSSSAFNKVGLIKDGKLTILNANDEDYHGADIATTGKFAAIALGTNKLRLYEKLDETYTSRDITDKNIKWSSDVCLSISKDSSVAYTQQGYFVFKQTDDEGKEIIPEWFFKDDIVSTYLKYSDGYVIAPTNGKYYYYNSVYYDADHPTSLSLVKFDYSSTEALLSLTKELTINDPDYKEWEERRNKILQSKLTIEFDGRRWFAINNEIYHSSIDYSYVSMNDYITLGDDDPITGFNLANDSLLIAYKKNRLYLVNYGQVGDFAGYVSQETKNTVGNEAFGGTIVTTLTERPLQINKDGIYSLNQLTNVQSSDRISVLISEGINKKWLEEENQVLVENAITINRLYWTYFILRDKDMSKVFLLDNRTSSWFYWELPIYISKAFIKDNKTHFVNELGTIYCLETKDIFNKLNPEETEYYDDGKKLINWYWQSQILPLGTINYSKRLINTTFIVTDTDESDRYGVNYSFKIYRKLVSESNATTVSNNLNYVQSVTKKTMIPRFNFIQIKLSNIDKNEDGAFDNNKFRLVGLGLKYVLLEGLY